MTDLQQSKTKCYSEQCLEAVTALTQKVDHKHNKKLMDSIDERLERRVGKLVNRFCFGKVRNVFWCSFRKFMKMIKINM